MADDKRYQEEFIDNRESGKQPFQNFQSTPNNNAGGAFGHQGILPNTPHKKEGAFKSIIKSMGFIFKSVIVSLAFIGLLNVLIAVGMIAIIANQSEMTYELPDKMFLSLNLDDVMSESRSSSLLDGISSLDNQDLLLHETIKVLNNAAKDDRVKGVFATLSNTELGIAQLHELRTAIENFGKTGKETVIFSESMGAFGTGTAEYYLASAFQNINLVPTGEVGLTGLKAELPFIRTPLEKLGIKPSFSTRHEYKTGASIYTDSEFTDINKKAIEKMLDDIYEQMVADIAKSRNKSTDEIKELINNGPYLAHEALNNGLVDNLIYFTDLDKQLSNKHKEAALISSIGYLEDIEPIELTSFEAFISDDGEDITINGTPEIAVLNAFGTILSGESKGHKKTGSAKLGSDTFTNLLEFTEDNENIKAVVIRVDSPGGGYVPSDIIRKQIVKLKEAGKPVIISMGNVAASGGYFISIASDKIVAEPSTITGSIGVYGGKMVIKDMWDKLGIKWGSVSKGKNAGMASMNSDFTTSQRIKFEQSLDNIYEDFTQKVSAARKIPMKKMDEIARGRVWTGRQALEIGLVDELGGLDKAIELAKAALELEEGDKIKINRYPKPKTPEEMLLEFLSTGKLPDSFAKQNHGIKEIMPNFVESIANPTLNDVVNSTLQLQYWIEAATNQRGALIMNPINIK
ncbi:MAG: signal peptide peptidase SppA [Alphaproteobacteria bacterium]|nr:signal peptide peptidase SppA [Alphaproteobacteria bacterium]